MGIKKIIGVKVYHRRTDRQTDRQTNSLTPYTGVCGFFLLVKFATSLLASLAGGLIIFCHMKSLIYSECCVCPMIGE